MRQFLNRNSVSMVGAIIAGLSAYMFWKHSTAGVGEDFGFLFGIYQAFLGFTFGFAISLATMRHSRFSPENHVILYTVVSEIIYFSVFMSIGLSSRISRFSDFIMIPIVFGIPSAIGAVLLLYLTQLTLKLYFKATLYLAFFITSVVLVSAAFMIETTLERKLISAIPLWQIAFAFGLNEILKRQKKESLQTASSAPEQSF